MSQPMYALFSTSFASDWQIYGCCWFLGVFSSMEKAKEALDKQLAEEDMEITVTKWTQEENKTYGTCLIKDSDSFDDEYEDEDEENEQDEDEDEDEGEEIEGYVCIVEIKMDPTGAEDSFFSSSAE